ncbi:MAG: MMPL family transporter [Candidatus Altiarchaeales archaeon]|nr:MMPL family transporter [Candidatus Altiarchaeales archaeon]MBD3415534.1 MMPL family transporter [Candidatus Altiarchaeales archaeon]
MSREHLRRGVKAYAHFIASHPFIVLALALAATVFAAQLQSTLEIVSMNQEDFLPEDRPVVVAFEKIGDEFGGLNTLTVVVETDPQVPNSNEVRDNLDPRMIAYGYTLHRNIMKLDEVGSVTSASSLLREGNGGSLPKSVERSMELWKATPTLDQYLSKDHTLLLVKAEVLPDLEAEDTYDRFDSIIKDTPRPPGLRVYMVGEIPGDVEVDRHIGSDMQRVMSYTMAGILVVVLLVMGNLAYGILPLFTIIFGTVWSMGMWAGLGQDLTHQTSGVSSMIMGIGIDFGIQTITRFRQELARVGGEEEAIAETLANVVLPMSTTTISALIGFRAMTMGELSFLGDMGGIMSLGVLGCMLAALTIVPALIVIYVRYVQKIKIGEVLGR